ncbi:MAG: hypothetical protein LC725_12270 [Lentisphaerae bacterium]|nr:hypothetical protein [Lentisphaerota bacterium]
MPSNEIISWMDEFDRYVSGEPLRIGNQWQLLLDDTIVEDRFRLKRRLCPIAKPPCNPIVTRDRPWEGDGVGRVQVIWDPAWSKYRMWYRCCTWSHPLCPGGYSTYICHAVSDDGLTWIKKELDVVTTPGFNRTNIVYTGTYYPRVDYGQVWRDEDDPDPGRRYKMVVLERRRNIDGLHLIHSSDGLNWRLDEHTPALLDYHSDCANHIVRDHKRERWLLYCRPVLMTAGSPAGGRRADLPAEITGLDIGPRRHPVRRVSVAVSHDMRQWSFPRTVLYPDERDLPDIDHCLVMPAGSGFVMLAAAMQGDTDGRTELCLASSPDGLRWHRHHTREPFIARGPAGQWDGGRVGCGSAIRQGEKILIYYSGSNLGQHEKGSMTDGIGVAFANVGRFGEQAAGEAPGFLLTREIIMEGNRLLVNTTGIPAGAAAAALRVEILQRPPMTGHAAADAMLNPAQMVVKGFSLADCDPISDDGTEIEVSWNGCSDLSTLLGKPVYLRFQLSNKGLCAFCIARG